jgi:aminoglycoside 2''-phosphotransferase
VTTIDDYLAHIASLGHAIDETIATLNQEGMVNDIVVLDDGLTFRFPKSPRGRELLLQEAHLLSQIRPHVAVQIPELTLHDGKFASYQWLPGQPMTREYLQRLEARSRSALLRQLAIFLRDLHVTPLGTTGLSHLSDAARSQEDWIAFYDRVREVIYPLLMNYQRESITALFEPVIKGELELGFTPVIVHGDLAPYHLLVDPDGPTLSGVIDFGVAGLGDPATDISLLLYNYGPDIVTAMADVYPVNAAVLARSRFWAGTLELQWALSGLEHDDRSLLVAHIGSARGFNMFGSGV